MSDSKSNTLPNPSVFSERIRQERRKQGLTIEQLAERAYISPDTLTSYLRKSATTPSLPNAMAIADALHVSLDYLCGMNEVKEISHEQQFPPETLLMNLYTAAEDAGLIVQADTQHSTTTFTSNNIHVAYFFSQAQRCRSFLEVRELAERFKKFVVLNHQLVDEKTYRQYMEDQRLYGDIDEEDFSQYAEESQSLIEERKSEGHL